jgi:hypothetical protein
MFFPPYLITAMNSEIIATMISEMIAAMISEIIQNAP